MHSSVAFSTVIGSSLLGLSTTAEMRGQAKGHDSHDELIMFTLGLRLEQYRHYPNPISGWGPSMAQVPHPFCPIPVKSAPVDRP